MNSIVRRVLILCVSLALGLPLAAQSRSTPPEHHLTFNFGGGVTPTVGDISKRLNTGWNIVAGLGWNFTRHFTMDGEYQYNGLGVDRSVLNEFNVPQGDAHIWSLTANAIGRIHPEGPVGAYVIGGGGFYRRIVEFTKPTLAQTLLFDPFLGIIFPALVPANQVLGTFSENAGGINLGGGITFNLGHTGTKLYVESRYHWIDTRNHATQIVPVTFGVRW